MCLQHTPWCLLKLSYSSPLAPTHVLWPVCHVNDDRRCIVFFNAKQTSTRLSNAENLALQSVFPVFRVGVFFLCSCCVWTSQDCFISQTSPNAGYRAVETEYLKILISLFVLFLLLSKFSVHCCYCYCYPCMSECLVISQTLPQCVQESSSIWVSPTSPKIDTNPPLPHLSTLSMLVTPWSLLICLFTGQWTSLQKKHVQLWYQVKTSTSKHLISWEN